MTLLKYLFTATLLIINSINVFGHALFIETKSEGKKGQPQEITVFYAEPNDPKREVIEDWWSDTKDFTLWLTLPNGTKEKLTTSKQKDHFTALFTPLLDGIYYVSVHHNVASLYGKTQYQFNTASSIHVGKTKNRSDLKDDTKSDALLMYQTTSNNKEEVSIAVINNSEPLVEAYITVFAPNGWQKDIKTNAEGLASFKPEWPGTYLLEASKKEEVANKEFTEKQRIVTTTVTLNNSF